MGKYCAFIAVSLLLVGCGGGNSAAPAPTPTPSPNPAGMAQGVYLGSSETEIGNTFYTIILPDDTMYAFYGTDVFSGGTIGGVIIGHGKSNNGSYTAAVQDSNWQWGPRGASVAASYAAGKTLNGTVTEAVTSFTFTGTELPSFAFLKNTPGRLGDVTGTWSGKLFSEGGTASAITVNPDGTVEGTYGSFCFIGGTVTPDTSFNFFNVTLSILGGRPCGLLENATATGVAVQYLLADGVTHQLVMIFDTSGGLGVPGAVFLSTR